MKTPWYYRLPVKMAAFVLTAALVVAGAWQMATAGVAMLLSGPGYAQDAGTRAAEIMLYEYAEDVLMNSMVDATALQGTIEHQLEGLPVTYQLSFGDGPYTDFGNYDGGDFLATGSAYNTHEVYQDSGWRLDYEATLTLYAAAPVPADSELGQLMAAVEGWHAHRWWRLVGGGLCWLLAVVGAVFLHHAAGRRVGEALPRRNGFDYIPFDLVTAVYVVLAVVEGHAFAELCRALDWWGCLLTFGMLAADVPLLMLYTLSFATRVKTRTLWSGSVLGFCLTRVWRAAKAFVHWLPLVWKTALFAVVLAVVEFLYILGGEMDNVAVFWLVKNLILIPLLVLVAIGLRRLQRGAANLAAGQLEEQIDTVYLPGDLRRSATDLNHIGDGLSTAVEARVKSERFKTELITNVSHDIKTPLTSIVNYVDLLAKEPTDNEKITEYVAVLARQSARLKKLTEDLVEASKASTGNVAVKLEPCNLQVLLEQLVGEYAQRAETAGLEVRLRVPAVATTVSADGRHLWRVLDNLMSNVCKYALGGTRVYVDLTALNGTATMTFRNVSRQPLELEGEELTERFVRGDSSRHTEGSGLGLAIARSLTELQGGTLSVTVDGDLFKVAVTMPLCAE